MNVRRLRARWGRKLSRRRLLDKTTRHKTLFLKRLNKRTFARRFDGAMGLNFASSVVNP